MSETLHRAQVGSRLRAAIEALGLTQADAAKKFDTSPSKLGNWLRGDNYPAEWFVKQFCDRYGITTDWIYRGIVTGIVPSDLADALWRSEQAALQREAEAGEAVRHDRPRRDNPDADPPAKRRPAKNPPVSPRPKPRTSKPVDYSRRDGVGNLDR